MKKMRIDIFPVYLFCLLIPFGAFGNGGMKERMSLIECDSSSPEKAIRDTRPFSFHAGLGYYAPSLEYLELASGLDFTAGPMPRFTAGWRPFPFLECMAGAGYFSSFAEFGPSSEQADRLGIRLAMLDLSLVSPVRILRDPDIELYAGGGAGLLSAQTVSETPGSSVVLRQRSATWHLLAGIDWSMSHRYSLGLQARYLQGDYEQAINVPGVPEPGIAPLVDISGLYAGVRFGARF